MIGSSREALPKNVVEGLYGLGSCPGVDLPTFLDSVLEIGLMETGADAGGAIFVTDRTGKQLFWSLKALLGTPRRPRQELVREWSGHALAPAIRRLGHEFIPVVSLASGDSKGYTLFEESRFAAWVPIIQRESEVGWLQLETRAPEAFSQRSLPVLAELARHAGRLVRRLLVRDHGAAHGHDVHMVGRSPRLLALERQLELLAADPRSPVLLCGERGSGKELAAYAVHYFSPRCDGPFIAINSAAFTPELIPDALFGHTRGAFSGADDVRGGIFLEAEGGSLFFDEIGDMPLHVQASLLRALDRGEIRPVGADRPRRVDVRILAATNRDLHAMMEEGTFRRDLFDRLDVFRVTVPPLRERRRTSGYSPTSFCAGPVRRTVAVDGCTTATPVSPAPGAQGGCVWIPAFTRRWRSTSSPGTSASYATWSFAWRRWCARSSGRATCTTSVRGGPSVARPPRTYGTRSSPCALKPRSARTSTGSSRWPRATSPRPPASSAYP